MEQMNVPILGLESLEAQTSQGSHCRCTQQHCRGHGPLMGFSAFSYILMCKDEGKTCPGKAAPSGTLSNMYLTHYRVKLHRI